MTVILFLLALVVLGVGLAWLAVPGAASDTPAGPPEVESAPDPAVDAEFQAIVADYWQEGDR